MMSSLWITISLALELLPSQSKLQLLPYRGTACASLDPLLLRWNKLQDASNNFLGGTAVEIRFNDFVNLQESSCGVDEREDWW